MKIWSPAPVAEIWSLSTHGAVLTADIALSVRGDITALYILHEQEKLFRAQKLKFAIASYPATSGKHMVWLSTALKRTIKLSPALVKMLGVFIVDFQKNKILFRPRGTSEFEKEEIIAGAGFESEKKLLEILRKKTPGRNGVKKKYYVYLIKKYYGGGNAHPDRKRKTPL